MPVLRLFAAAREAAGTATDEVPGVTVEEVLAAARSRYGPQFAAVLDASKVWRNGEPAGPSDPVGEGDEVAVLPPVSGGSGPGVPPEEPDQPRPRPRARPEGPAPARPGVARPGPTRPRPDRRPGSTGARPGPPDRRRSPISGPRSAASGPGGRPPTRSRPRPALSSARARAEGLFAAARRAPGALARTSVASTGPLAAHPAPARGVEETSTTDPPARLTRLTRLRPVDVPVTGHVEVRGKERRVSGPRVHRTGAGRRYAVVYDTSGWKVSLGLVWFAAVLGSLVLGWAPLTLLYAVAAGWAAIETATRWCEAGTDADVRVAALGAGAIGAAGASGARYVGGAILLTVLAVVAVAAVGIAVRAGARGAGARDQILAVAGSTAHSAVPFGLAAACVVLTRDLEIGAAVVLILFVSVYEAGDFLIGSGSSNSIEGPLSGIVAIAVTALVVAALAIPPFDGTAVFAFAALAAVACPLGQLAGSALLPAADAHAPAARRLDSLLLLAPLWVWAAGIFLGSTA
ncbi:MoaD/ThiS family protein [Iamia sp.]|uniref:MoaD/ThiS family protein n=1 Tax=Iamia sp. TaxID=2722710 RepID=UPI002C8AA24F|nr:MoaD/ThiS family protein [Iamia sp.]HXH58835.1 MoaD/ThiS family protein [Iamia sp.]